MSALSVFGDLHSKNHIAARDAIDDFHSTRDLPENGVAAIQMRLRRVSDEKLAAAGVLARKGHTDRASTIGPGIDLAANLIAGAALAVAARITPLNNEIRNDTVKSDVAEE